MFKKAIILSSLLTFGAFSYAAAACTVEEAQAKAMEFQQAIMTAAQSNPQKYQDAMLAMQKDLPELQKINDMDALCKFYDEWSEKLK